MQSFWTAVPGDKDRGAGLEDPLNLLQSPNPKISERRGEKIFLHLFANKYSLCSLPERARKDLF